MQPKAAEKSGGNWLRLGAVIWPAFWLAVTFGVPQVERAWDARQVKREAELTAPADLRRRLEARILRADPKGLRRDWRVDKGETDPRCADYSQALNWSLCWKPDGALEYGVVSGLGRIKAEDVVASVVWVFTPMASPKDMAALTALASSGKPGRMAAGGIDYEFRFCSRSQNTGCFLIFVGPAD